MNNKFEVRKPTRLKCFDYSSKGYYFITLCTQNRCNILSEIVGCGFPDAPQNILTDIGKIVDETIEFIDKNNENVCIDKYVIMPNHIHLIIVIKNGSSWMPTPTDNFVVSDNPANDIIPKCISSLKRYTNKKCKKSLWQRSYNDHIIRNEQEYIEIYKYIENNPYKWLEDKYYGHI